MKTIEIIYKILVLLLFYAGISGSINAQDASLGTVLCGDFHKGQLVDLSHTDKLSHHERLKFTIGLNEETLKKAGTAQNYIQKRGISTIAGKLFEESYTRKFQRKFTRKFPEYRLENTALLGKPHDPADLILVKHGTIVEKYQQKLSFSEANKAIRKAKYCDCKILVPCDVYKELQSSKKVYIQEAIQSGRLTDRVLGIPTDSSFRYKRETKYFVRNIRHTAVPIKVMPILSDMVGGIFDLSSGIRIVYSTRVNYRLQMVDRDIAQIQLLLGIFDSFAGITGVSLVMIPGVGKICGIIGIVIESNNALLKWVQKRRYENQRKLLLHLRAEDRSDAIHRLILQNLY